MASRTVDWRDMPPDSCRGGAVAIGNFDGVHRGHAALIAEARTRAGTGPTVALTFDPHPLQLLRPDRFLPVLTTAADRARLLQEVGADEVILLQTTPELLALSAQEFFDQVLRQRLAPRALVEGPNFGFGHNREGNIDTLAELCRTAGIDLTVVPPVRVNGMEVSSSRVRAALMDGAVDRAAVLLGRPHRLHGTVGEGQHRGQTLGFPTANLHQFENLVPGDGVYAVRVPLGDRVWPAAASVGPNPTFGEQARKVEVHILDFRGDLYGQPLAVDFVQRLRDIRTFAGVAELTAQLKADVEQARRVAGAMS